MAKKVIKRKNSTKATQLPIKGLFAAVEKIENPTTRSDFPEFRAGDTVRVAVKIKECEKERVQNYDGLVIARSNRGGSKSFNVRKMSHGVGVERIFLESSPKIAKIEVLERGKVRRAKLYYIRGLEGRAAKIERDIDATKAVAATNLAKKA
jgi:large subunit ribosomal protein L19